MKRSLSFLCALSLVTVLAACNTVADSDQDDNSDSSASSVVSSQESSASASSESSSVQAETRIINIEASNWTFTPASITVKKGEKVQLKITNVSGVHGLLVQDLGIDLKLAEGATGTVDLPTDKTGTFSFRCNTLCGEGHKDMTGTITITE